MKLLKKLLDLCVSGHRVFLPYLYIYILLGLHTEIPSAIRYDSILVIWSRLFRKFSERQITHLSAGSLYEFACRRSLPQDIWTWCHSRQWGACLFCTMAKQMHCRHTQCFGKQHLQCHLGSFCVNVWTYISRQEKQKFPKRIALNGF